MTWKNVSCTAYSPFWLNQVGPAVAPSSTGFYNTTLRASNATGTLNQDQSSAFAQQLQSTVANSGTQTGFRVVNQNASPQGSSTAGRKLSQTSQVFLLSRSHKLSSSFATPSSLHRESNPCLDKSLRFSPPIRSTKKYNLQVETANDFYQLPFALGQSLAQLSINCPGISCCDTAHIDMCVTDSCVREIQPANGEP